MVNFTVTTRIIQVEADVILRFKDGQEQNVGEISWEVPVTVAAGEKIVRFIDPEGDDDE